MDDELDEITSFDDDVPFASSFVSTPSQLQSAGAAQVAELQRRHIASREHAARMAEKRDATRVWAERAIEERARMRATVTHYGDHVEEVDPDHNEVAAEAADRRRVAADVEADRVSRAIAAADYDAHGDPALMQRILAAQGISWTPAAGSQSGPGEDLDEIVWVNDQERIRSGKRGR